MDKESSNMANDSRSSTGQRFVVYAYDPKLRVGGILDDKGHQVAELNHAYMFTLEEALHLHDMNMKYHTCILQVLL